MGTIRISVDDLHAISVFEIEGTVKASEIVDAMERQYVEGAPVHALWDYSQATFHELSAEDYERIATAAKALAPQRPNGRTAFVAPGALEAVAIRFLEASSKKIVLPLLLRICTTREEAIDWLTAPE